ncbi:hypothetical protein HFO56_02525 [Rhizobium laguerreae]|uniref:hypothetical protein n=1 Tax=Rhizobium laguerreae TaxID=1076926 RepID=UPI001C910D30|nr:hypothetical protein [Rhizobium laguerreae]MBY3151260.1 hypothetical protein [Rhizobium laguerreae]
MTVHMQGPSVPQAGLRFHAAQNVASDRRKPIVSRLLPFNLVAWRKRKLCCDTVITAHNPVLAIILLKQALGMGLSCVLSSDPSGDGWPCDLAGHPQTTTVIAAALGVPAGRYGESGRFLAGLAEEFIAPSADLVTRLPAGLALTPHCRQRDGELALTTVANNEPGLLDADGGNARGVLAQALETSRVATPAKDGGLVVFTNRTLLTGRTEAFAPTNVDARAISYANPCIHAVGTAARIAVADVEKAEMMVDDIFRCARFEF